MLLMMAETLYYIIIYIIHNVLFFKTAFVVAEMKKQEILECNGLFCFMHGITPLFLMMCAHNFLSITPIMDFLSTTPIMEHLTTSYNEKTLEVTEKFEAVLQCRQQLRDICPTGAAQIGSRNEIQRLCRAAWKCES